MNMSYEDHHHSGEDSYSWRSRPNSPSKIECSYSYSSKRRSCTPEPSDYSSKEGDSFCRRYRFRIYDDCEEPVMFFPEDGGRKDAEIQVVATDIKNANHAQTGESLSQRGPEASRRSLNQMCNMTARRSWNLNCDCEEYVQEDTTKLIDECTQVDPRDIGSSESVQTGPSLLAAGPFCPFDYKLRKVRNYKDDTYAECVSPTEFQSSVPCSMNRDGCSHFHQQVCAIDIAVSEWAQTGETVPYEPEVFKDGMRRLPACGKVYKNDALLDCESPDGQDDGFQQKAKRNFIMQVKATNICPSKQCQTDACLQPGVCLAGRLFKCLAWEECQSCVPLDKSQVSSKTPMVRNFSNQVYPTDICECEETQTGTSLALGKPYRKNSGKRAGYVKNGKSRPVAGRARNYKFDDCECSLPPPKKGALLDACTQVRACEIITTSFAQTKDLETRIKKYFIRGGHWSC